MEIWHCVLKGFGVRREFLLSVAVYSSLSSLISVNTLCLWHLIFPPALQFFVWKGHFKGFLNIILLLFMKCSWQKTTFPFCFKTCKQPFPFLKKQNVFIHLPNPSQWRATGSLLTPGAWGGRCWKIINNNAGFSIFPPKFKESWHHYPAYKNRFHMKTWAWIKDIHPFSPGVQHLNNLIEGSLL